MVALRRSLSSWLVTSLQARLLLIVLLALIPAFGLTLYNANEQRRLAANSARHQLTQWARQAQINQHQLIVATHQLLLSLAELPAIREQGPIPCNELLAAIKTYPYYANLGVMDRNGTIVCSAVSTMLPVHLNERPYLRRVLETPSVPVGEFEIGVLATEPTINIAIPLVNEHTQTVGLIFAALDTNWFDTFAQDANLPPNATLLIIALNNSLITRAPTTAHNAQFRMSNLDVQVLTQAPDLTATIPDLDGVTRLYVALASETLPNQTTWVGIGVPVAAAYAQADQLLWRTLIALTLAGWVATTTAWVFGKTFILQPVENLIDTAKQLRAGNLTARASSFRSGELASLAHTFNEMASELQSRDEQRAHAQAAEREQRTFAESLREIASALNSTLDYDQVLDRILDSVGRVVLHDTSNIMLFEAGAARVVRSRGYSHFSSDDWIMTQRFDLHQFENMRKALAPDSPANLISDTRDNPAWVDLAEARWIRSHLAVPIRTKGRVIGILNLDSATPGFFTVAHASRLQVFADQAAIALENARLLRESQARASQFAALYATASDLAAPQRALPLLLNTIIERAVALLNSFGGAVYLYRADLDELELVTQKGIALPNNFRVKSGAGVVGLVADKRHSIIVDDYQVWHARMPQLDTHAIRAVIGVPMLYGGELIGVLTVAERGTSTRRFSEADTHLLALFAGLAASAVQNARLFQETRTRAEQLALLYDAGLALNSVLEPHAQLEFLFKIMMQALHADRAEFLRYMPETNSLQIELAIGFSPAVQTDLHKLDLPLTNTNGVVTWVASQRIPLYLPDVHDEPRWILIDPQVASGLWVPVENGKNLLGVLAVLSTQRNAFTPEDERLMVLFANQVAVALSNARLFQDLRQSQHELSRAYDATLEGWSRALDLRDEETEGHTRRVTELSVQLAHALNLTPEQIEHIRRGALLHDIGKMGIPDRILFKPGPLTDAEWAIMKKHPEYAAELISAIEYLRPALDIPKYHHERWDGQGYPYGLAGDAIPLAARIFAIADIWDALLSHRPYRDPWTKSQVTLHIASLAGTHLDPTIVSVFLQVMHNHT